MSDPIKLYAFASDTLTNIWAGVGANLWAVAPVQEGAYAKGRRTKASKVPIGSCGILFSNQHSALTVPFVIYSKANPEIEIDDVWPERWVLPFKIKPLGTPGKMMTVDRAKKILPVFSDQPNANFTHVFRVRGDFAFQPSPITAADWEILIQELAI